jgi:hypothetical protein
MSSPVVSLAVPSVCLVVEQLNNNNRSLQQAFSQYRDGPGRSYATKPGSGKSSNAIDKPQKGGAASC